MENNVQFGSRRIMGIVLLVSCLLTVLIHCAETLSYSIRLAGVRTGKLAVALSLTGILLLVSRTANLVLSPLSGRIIDIAKAGEDVHVAQSFHWIIAASTAGTLLGMMLFPSFVHLFSRMVYHLDSAGSLPRMLTSVTFEQVKHVRSHLRKPRWTMLRSLRYHGISNRLILINIVITGVYTVGVLSALYASYLAPELGTAASQSSGLINGLATILLTVFIDPRLAVLTDKGLKEEEARRTLSRVFGMFMISRLIGTLLAQFLLLPGAYWIGWVANLLP
jgi:hypothetical protein